MCDKLFSNLLIFPHVQNNNLREWLSSTGNLKNVYHTALFCCRTLCFSASSNPGALNNNGTSYHIVHCPVVLKKQKCDEGWEKEGNWKVLVQGSNGWSVEGDRERERVTKWCEADLEFNNYESTVE